MPNPIGLAAAFALLALTVSTTDIAPAVAAAETPATHTVAIDGSGDFTSIQAAVDAASDGDTVVVRPGTYPEAVTIDKDLSLIGDGPREGIVIAASVGSSTERGRANPNRPHAIRVSGGSVIVSNLTVATPDYTIGLVATAGAPVIERVTFVGSDELETRTTAHAHRLFSSLVFFGETSPTVRDSEWDGYVAVRDGASVAFTGNTVFGDTISIDGPGETSVRDSILHRGSISMSEKVIGVVEGNEFRGDITQVGVDSGSVVEVRGNTFTGSVEDAAIWVEGLTSSAVVAGNAVSDSNNALRITGGGTVTVEANMFDVAGIGVAVTGTDARIEGNSISSDGAGIVIISGANPMVTSNTIEAGKRAIVVGRGSAPIISDNVVCGGEVNLYVEDGAEPDIGDNELCEDASTE